MKRLQNISERAYDYFIRYQLGRGGLRFNWRIYGQQCVGSMTKRYHFDTNWHTTGTSSRDLFDQIFDFLCDEVKTLFMFIREEWCSHPRAAVYEIDEGDEECGHYIQIMCGKCGGCITSSIIDRY